jgi:hypothetical protein
MAEMEKEEGNPHIEQYADSGSLPTTSGLSGGRAGPHLLSGDETASDTLDPEESLLRRIEAVEENVFSQMLEILQEDEANVLKRKYQSQRIQNLDRDSLRALILEDFTSVMISRDINRRKIIGATQDSTERPTIDASPTPTQQMRISANGAAGNQVTPSPLQSTSLSVTLEQAIAGLWPELQLSATSRAHDHRR